MEAAIKNCDIEAFRNALPSTSTEESKEAVNIGTERLIRSLAMQMVKRNVSVPDIEKQFVFVVELAKIDLCPKSLTVVFIHDILDCLPKQRCAEVFTIVENYIDIWKSQDFFDSCRNSVLRMCNDLLKRLSRTIDTQFCGRVNILLSRSLPLFEKSGLNIAGQFNSANDTVFEEVDEIELKSTSDGNVENGVDIEVTAEIPVDFDVYRKFWGLQKYFSEPNKVYQRADFDAFQLGLNDVLNIFTTYKLDKKRGNKEYEHYLKMDGIEESFKRPDVFFAKYQTSQKLLHLQFADPQFRRYFFVQVLILANYIQSEVNQKFRDLTLFLTDDQNKYIAEVTEKCYKLLRDTYPKGFQFSEFVKKVLNREKVWSTWKNEGCPDWLGNRPERQIKPFKKQEVEHFDPSVIDLGNKSLTTLWNLSKDNLSACRDPKRNFVPSVEEVIEEALDHVDPEQGIEAAYSCFNNEVWQWKSNRLFLIDANHYLTIQSTPAGKKPCAEYSEVMQHGVFAVAMNGKNETLRVRGTEISKKVEEAKIRAEEDLKKAEEAAKVKAEEEAKQKALEAAAERKKKDEEAALQKKKELEEKAATKKSISEESVKRKSIDGPPKRSPVSIREKTPDAPVKKTAVEAPPKKVNGKSIKVEKEAKNIEVIGNGNENRPASQLSENDATKKDKRRVKEEKLPKEEKKDKSQPTTPATRKRDRRSLTPLAISDDESIPKKRDRINNDHLSSRHSVRTSRTDDRHRRSTRARDDRKADIISKSRSSRS